MSAILINVLIFKDWRHKNKQLESSLFLQMPIYHNATMFGNRQTQRWLESVA